MSNAKQETGNDQILKAIEGLGKKMVELDVKNEKRFEKVDKQFESVDQQFRLMDNRFVTIDRRFNTIDERFNGIDEQFEGVERKFEGINQKFEGIDDQFKGIDDQFEGLFEIVTFIKDTAASKEDLVRVETGLEVRIFDLESRMGAGFSKLDKKIDTTKNELMTHIDGVVGLFHRLDTEYVALCARFERWQAAA